MIKEYRTESITCDCTTVPTKPEKETKEDKKARILDEKAKAKADKKK